MRIHYPQMKVDGRIMAVHTYMVEQAVGRRLKKPEEVHHVDGNPQNNSPDNLVACPSREYHKLLHQRTKALDACGNANWRQCKFCRKYDDPQNLTFTSSYNLYHKVCSAAYRLQCLKARKEMK
jgi:hypothetical protein